MARRSGWSNLSESYRKRLVGSGVTRTEWERGVDLRKSRGHRSKGAAPKGGDEQALQRWFRQKPQWLAGLPIDIAAPLSELRPVNRWRNAVLLPSTGETWGMSVEYKDGSFQDITVPHGAVGDLMDWLDDQEVSGEPLDWTVGDSP